MSGRPRFCAQGTKTNRKRKSITVTPRFIADLPIVFWMPDADWPCVERLWIRDESRIYGGGRNSAIYRGSANRLRMQGADLPCVERLRRLSHVVTCETASLHNMMPGHPD